MGIPFVVQADLKLEDFAGQYISYGFRTAGFGETDLASFIAQVQVDKHGNGKINFLTAEETIKTGTGPAIKILRAPPPNVTFKITIKNPIAQAGEITTFNFPITGETFLTDFVAIKKNGKVEEFIQNLVDASTPPSSSVLFFTSRQH